MTSSNVVEMIRYFGISFRSHLQVWYKPAVPKRPTIPEILRPVLTQKIYNISFIVAKILDLQILRVIT